MLRLTSSGGSVLDRDCLAIATAPGMRDVILIAYV
jgi:hypothetical protein